MKERILKTDLLPDMAALFYMGQVGFIIKCRGKYMLIDGYLSDYVDKNCSNELVKWERLYPAPIDAEELDFIDYVFCTHSHFDHADPYTLSKIAKVNSKAKYIVSEAIADVIESYGISKADIIGVKCDDAITLDDDFKVTAIPAAHEELHKDDNGNYLEVGFKIEMGDITLFHAGDGCPYEGLEERIKGSDILIMPVNGRDYYRRYECDIIGCFDSGEAIKIAKRVDAKLLIPCHIDLYEVNKLNPAYFVDCLKNENPNQAFHIFAPGEKFVYQR